MYLYSVMAPNSNYIDEICNDVKRQYEQGIATMALFFVKLVPEKNPPIDKAKLFAENYILFRDKLAKMGLKCGILVQCTIGHGYPLNQMFGFTQYINLNNGNKEFIACPYDENFRNYLRDQFATLASLNPEIIMVDDDFRLMQRSGMGCACGLHMKSMSAKINKVLSREELFDLLTDTKNQNRSTYIDAYIETQRESLIGAANAMREGIDSVDPSIQGVFCSIGNTTEFGAEIAKILAGRKNPVIARINNGNYCAAGTRYISSVAYRFAQQNEILKNEGVEFTLSEPDTCPHNRYSTSAQSLHTHMVISILEGSYGAKHWITRLPDHEPRSGEAYRKILGKHAGFYKKLAEVSSAYERIGCRIPLPRTKDYGFDCESMSLINDAWSKCVLERYGVPIYYSSKSGGATFLDGNTYIFTDGEITEMLKGTLFISSEAANQLCERGFSDAIGVTVREWSGPNPSRERVNSTHKICLTQSRIKELIPNSEKTTVDSTIYHLKGGKDEIPVAPGVTLYQNSCGGTVVTFSGSPSTNFHYTEFGFLTETRKDQIVRLICHTHGLPIYFIGDEEVYMNCSVNSEGELLVSICNISLDPLESVSLKTEIDVKSVEMLAPDGSRVPLEFTLSDNILEVSRTVHTYDPLILFIS